MNFFRPLNGFLTLRNGLLVARNCIKKRCVINSRHFSVADNEDSPIPAKTFIHEMFNCINLAYYTHKRVNKNDLIHLLTNINKYPEILKEEPYGIQLLSYNGQSMPDEHPEKRTESLWKIWNMLQENDIPLNFSHYNSLLQMLNENKTSINCIQFLKDMKCEPNDETFNLLLTNSCQVGNVKEATEIIQHMKNLNIPITENVFNMLVLGHAIDGGLTNANIIIETMRAAFVAPTPTTYISLLKGLGIRKNEEEIKKTINLTNYYNFIFTPANVIEIVHFISTNGNQHMLPAFSKLIEDVTPIPRYLMNDVESLCIHLVHINLSEVAVKVWNMLGEPAVGEDADYCIFILKEMVKVKTPMEEIINIAYSLRNSGKNVLALEKVAEMCLQVPDVQAALCVFRKMKELNLPLRSHYFWPLFLLRGKSNGEEGALQLLQDMADLDVHADRPTLEYYVIPYCNLTQPKAIIMKLQKLNYTVTELITPLCLVLLKNKKVTLCCDLCEKYKISIQSASFIKPLAEAWLTIEDPKKINKLLRLFSQLNEKTNDFTGEFLIKALKMSRSENNRQKFFRLLQVIHGDNLKISYESSEILRDITKKIMHKSLQCQTAVLNTIDKLLDISLVNNTETSHIPHPMSMSVEDLENHLIELQHKNMETRGVIRKLIQEHCRTANFDRVDELCKQFEMQGYELSTGMLANLMDMHVFRNDLMKSMEYYKLIKKSNTNFRIDDFKLLNYVTMLVNNNKFDEGLEILKSNKTNRIARVTIQRNVWKLLSALAEKGDVNQTERFFETLRNLNYCPVTNVILGPLIKVHLNNNMEDAVEKYVEYCKVYKCTPLQHELLCTILVQKREDLLQKMVNATINIHGEINTRAAIVAALCECGLDKPIRKMLMEYGPKLNAVLELRCSRWLEEDKPEPIETLAKNAATIPGFRLDQIHMCVLKAYNLRNDCDGALQFLRNLEESEQIIRPELLNALAHMFDSNKKELPQDLIDKMNEHNKSNLGNKI